MPSPQRPTLVRRLPVGFAGLPGEGTGAAAELGGGSGSVTADAEEDDSYERAEGGLESRLLGRAIHELLERLSGLRKNYEPEDAVAKLETSLPAMVAAMRSEGLTGRVAQRLGEEAWAAALDTLRDAVGGWILAPHAEASSEVGWTAVSGGQIQNRRADRVFFSTGPDETYEAGWWVIDYKTSHEIGGHGSAASRDRAIEEDSYKTTATRSSEGSLERFKGQLQVYADILRGIHGSEAAGDAELLPIRGMIYCPGRREYRIWEL
jgi:hypothetical protein